MESQKSKIMGEIHIQKIKIPIYQINKTILTKIIIMKINERKRLMK